MFLLPFIFWNFLSILIEIGAVAYGNFSSTSATRITILLLNRHILVIVNRNIITYFCWGSNKSLVLNGNWKTVLDCVLILRFNCWSWNLLILWKLRFRFIKFDLQVFSGDHWSYNVLFVVNITWSLYGFSSEFFLNNWLSFDWFVFDNSISSINESNLNTFSFHNWLNNWLINIFVWRQRDFSSVYKSFNFCRSENWLQSFFDFSSFYYIQLFCDFSNSRFNYILVINNITINGYCSWFLFVTSLNRETSLSFHNSVLFLLKFRNQLLNSLIDSRCNDDSLSQGFDLIFGNYSRLTNDSFCDDFWLCCISLSDNLRFGSDVFRS